MAAQLVGEQGRVIGIDMNEDMLALARKYQVHMARKIGSDRVVFHKGYIQDLALDLDAMESYLARHPVKTTADYSALHDWQTRQRTESPLIADNSIDLVVSNCVLNLVHDEDKHQLIREIYRVLKPGGRVAISDIVSDEISPDHLKSDLELWSGCISGAFQEQAFIRAFLDVGFMSIKMDKWDETPWQIVDGIEFRSATLTAFKGEGTECMDTGQAVIYRGPYAEIIDDEGHIFPRGERMAVCERTFRYLTTGPHKDDFIGISPAKPREAVPWCAPAGTRRPASETKGAQHRGGSPATGCC
jgi:SAM-dependent methyltransferase